MNNKKDSVQEDERVFKTVTKVLPGVPKFLEKLGNRLENIDFSQPQSLTKAIEKDFESILRPLSQIKITLLFRLFKRFFLNKDYVRQKISKWPADLAIAAKKSAKDDSRYSLLMELIYEADYNYPYSPFLVVSRHGDLGKRYLANISPLQYLKNARKFKGELRANNTREAIFKITEGVYRPYIHTLWQLSYIRKGEKLPFQDLSEEIAYGNMLKMCMQNLPSKYHSLIEPDAVIMRNSYSHSTFEYDINNDAFIFQDKNSSSIVISVEVLLDKIESMYIISCSTIALVGQIYLFRLIDRLKVAEKFYDLLPEIFSGNESRIKTAEQCFIDFLQHQILQDLERFPLKSRLNLQSLEEAAKSSQILNTNA